MKKLVSIVLALAMLLMVGAAFAATSNVTINKTETGRTYTFYKIFDVTYDGTNTSTSYSGTDATFIAALQADGSPFEVEAELGGVYSITGIKSGKTPTLIRDWIEAHIPSDATSKVITPPTGTLDDGYYLMKVTKEGETLIASTLEVKGGTAVTVNDKNTTTTVDKQEEVAGTDYYVDEAGQGHKVEDPIPSDKVGQTVNYTLTGDLVHYIGGEKAVSFTFTDTLSTGLTRVQDVAVKIGNVTKTVDTDYTVTYSGQTMTIVIPTVNNDADKTFKYADDPIAYEITYSAVINEHALTVDVENNTVDLDFTDENGDTHEVDNDETKVKVYNIGLIKYDGKNTDSTDDDSLLAGATFKLYDASSAGNEIVVYQSKTATPSATTSNNTYLINPDVDDDYEVASTMIAGADGKIIVKGLARGTYYFEEIDPPAGFNKLTERKAITTADSATAGEPNFVSIDVINNHGTVLPSTGGIGTTIFYILGGLLVIGAAVILVARRKAHD